MLRELARDKVGDLAQILAIETAQVEQHAVLVEPREHGRAGPATESGARALTAGQRDRERRQRASRVGAAARERFGLDDFGSERREAGGEILGGDAESGRRGLDRTQGRDLRQWIPIPVDPQRRLESGQGQLVASEGPIQRVHPAARDQLSPADEDPALRAAQELVAGEQDESDPGGQAGAHAWLVFEACNRSVDEKPGAEIVGHDHALVLAGECLQFGQGRRTREAHDAEVARVDLQQHRGARADRTRVVAQVGAIGRPHLHHRAPRLGHHVGHAEPTADLDEFAARDHDLAALRQRAQHQVHRRGVVVDDQRALHAQQLAKETRHRFLALVAQAGDGIDLHDRVARRSRDRRHRSVRQRRPPDPRVQHDAGSVHDTGVVHREGTADIVTHGPRGTGTGEQRGHRVGCQRAAQRPRPDAIQIAACDAQERRPRQRRELGPPQERIQRRNGAKRGGRVALAAVDSRHRGIPYHPLAMESAALHLPEPDPRERAMAKTLGTSELIARVLLARGIDDPDRAREWLRPDLRRLADPFSFTGMERAIERVRQAISQGERILIHGDYDVDGITGSVLLLKLFGLVQADAKVHIPAREDGYSFTAASERAVTDGGFSLCISVDNGTNAVDSIARIQAAGCDVIVTDHHGTLENTAQPHTLINPRLPAAGYPDRELAGCGVAFRLAAALAASFSRGRAEGAEFREFLTEAMAYVALGTIADVAPLRGENRILVHHGLRALAHSPNPGLRALIETAGISGRVPTVDDVAFRIAPLINAAGRMGSAADAVALLSARGYHEAQEAAKVLEAQNERRRTVERELLEDAVAKAQARPEAILVLASEGWHAGVLGIVAARLTDATGKPTLLLNIEDGRARGSGRSAGSLDLRQALADCTDLLTTHGGHAAAVGLELPAGQIDAFRVAINERCGAAVRPRPTPPPDGQASLAELDVRALRALEALAPFGTRNPRPSFVTERVRLVGRPCLDPRGNDLRLRVAQAGQVLPARLANGAARCEELRDRREEFRLIHTPRLSRWSDDGPIELVVTHLEAMPQ